MIAGIRVLLSRKFWREFADFWSVDAMCERLDDFASRLREQTGQKPDSELERRRAARRTDTK